MASEQTDLGVAEKNRYNSGFLQQFTCFFFFQPLSSGFHFLDLLSLSASLFACVVLLLEVVFLQVREA